VHDEVPHKPILVTGSHRSGSTWVGHMLALDPSIGYINGPFNLHSGRVVCGAEFTNWFTYICSDNEAHFYEALKSTLNYHCDLKEALWRARSYRDLKQGVRVVAHSLQHRLRGRRPMVKDPIAFFSAEWLARTFGMDVVILIRHPAAFAGSLKVKNWLHPFDHFLNQPYLMRDMLEPFRADLEEFAHNHHDIIDQAALLWQIIYSTALEYKKNHTDWIFLRHEDLSLNPVGSFVELYERLGLEITEQIKQQMGEYSFTSRQSKLRRNSAKNVFTWKKRLAQGEIDRIRRRVEGVACHFYGDFEW
jgi:hypothetical protein